MVKIGLHAVAVLYTGGSVAQLLKLVYDFSWQEMPYIIDWLIVILGTVGAVTLTLQTGKIEYRGRWERPVHFLIIAHLAVSVIIHLWTIYVQNHHLFGAFPREYSYFAIAYFVMFAWRSWTIKLVSRGDCVSDT